MVQVLNLIIFLIDGVFELPDVELLDLGVAVLRPPQVLYLRDGLALILILEPVHLQLLEVVSLRCLILQSGDLHNLIPTSVRSF